MVHLNRIYTKSGDTGETSLGDGSRVSKSSPRIAAFGAVDELNAVIGIGIAHGIDDELKQPLLHIQNDLFDLGADLCVPVSPTPPEYPQLRIIQSQIDQLERWIDAFNDPMEPLKSFILPGGSLASANLHHARTVCRRAEIVVFDLVQSLHGAHQLTAIYLNRLSDLLFVMARVANNQGRNDVLWVPGGSRGATKPD